MKNIVLALLCLFSLPFAGCKTNGYYGLSTHYNPQDSLINFKDYPLVEHHARPYFVTGNTFVIFGATHTRNPEDFQMALIEEIWNDLQPTIALVEGKAGMLPPIGDPVKAMGENGKVTRLANKNNVPVYSWDLSKQELAKQLQPQFTKEQIALAQILNPYFSNLRFGKPASPEKFIKEYLHRAEYVGLGKELKSAADVDRVWKKYFPAELDWRNVSDEYGLPGYLAHMMAATNDLRNQKLIAVTKELTSKGERVFIICGSSHAVCVAPAFKPKFDFEEVTAQVE